MISSSVDNRQVVTIKRLESLSLITSRVMDLLKQQVDDGVLSTIKTPEDIEKFKRNIDMVLISKLKSKFNL